jgi:hypothetical protein
MLAEPGMWLTVQSLTVHDVVAIISGNFEGITLIWALDLHDLTFIIDEVAKVLQRRFELCLFWEACWQSAKHIEVVVVVET